MKLPYCQYKKNSKIFHGTVSCMPYRRACLISGCALVKLHCIRKSFYRFDQKWALLQFELDQRLDRKGFMKGCGSMKKRGRIHGYHSRLRVDRGHIWGHWSIWAGEMGSKNQQLTRGHNIVADGWALGRGIQPPSTPQLTCTKSI